jgi:pyruvate dehydrogenase (quinone)
MLGINGLVTIAEHWREWSDPRLVVMVLHNSDLNMVTWEQRAMAGDPKFKDSQDLPRMPFAEYARMLGLHGIRVDDPERIASAWDEALSAGRPALLEVITDANVPPLPPHVTMKEVKHYLKALLHGDPDAAEIVRASARQTWASLSTRG